jgi:hypothetical protein
VRSVHGGSHTPSDRTVGSTLVGGTVELLDDADADADAVDVVGAVLDGAVDSMVVVLVRTGPALERGSPDDPQAATIATPTTTTTVRTTRTYRPPRRSRRCRVGGRPYTPSTRLPPTTQPRRVLECRSWSRSPHRLGHCCSQDGSLIW